MKVNDNSEAVLKEVRRYSVAKLRTFAEVMTAKAKQLSPFAFGHNRRSIAFRETALWSASLAFIVYTESGYGGWLELGTSKMAPREYIRPSFDYARMRLKIMK